MNETLDPLRIQPEDLDDKVLVGDGSRLVLFDDGSEVAKVMLGVLVDALARHEHTEGGAGPLSGFVADGESFSGIRRRYESQRHIMDSFHLDTLPVIALFRKGSLVTTFEPWMHYAGKRLWRQDLGGQFETFLQKMVYFDPTKVQEQKNLHLNLP